MVFTGYHPAVQIEGTALGGRSQIKAEYRRRDAVTRCRPQPRQARPAVEWAARVRGKAAMIQQHAAHGLIVKALAHFSPEGFSQDEIFKAHALTQRSRHPVAKL